MPEPAKLVPRFAKQAFGPGDDVEGVLELREPMDGIRTLNAYLRYIDRSPSFADGVDYAEAVPLHEGPVEPGQEVPFSLALPEDAWPPWKHPATADYGTLTWSLVIEADVAKGLDKIITHDIPVDEGAAWTGPAPSGEHEIKETGRWDVTIEPSNWAPKRGESLSVDIAIEKPDAGRDTLEVGLTCQCFYMIEYRNSDRELRYTTNWVDMHEEWPSIDPAASEQTIEVSVPEDAPFSYPGKRFGFVWMALAREKRRMRGDPRRIAILQVSP